MQFYTLFSKLHSFIFAGGVASFRSNLFDLDGYLSPCLKEAQSRIPTVARSNSHVFFAATAGMRILRLAALFFFYILTLWCFDLDQI